MHERKAGKGCRVVFPRPLRILPVVRTWFLECECEPEEGWRFLGSNWIAVSPGIDVVARSVCSEVSDRSEWSRSSVYGQFFLVVEEGWVWSGCFVVLLGPLILQYG